MEQKALARWLKCMVVVMGGCVAVVYVFLVPLWGRAYRAAEPAMARYYWPWVISVWLTAVPVFWAAGLAYSMAVSIGQNRSFTLENAGRLKTISHLAAADGLFYLGINLVYALLVQAEPGLLLLCVLLCLLAAAISVAMAALSHLVRKAAALQEQSDLTI